MPSENHEVSVSIAANDDEILYDLEIVRAVGFQALVREHIMLQLLECAVKNIYDDLNKILFTRVRLHGRINEVIILPLVLQMADSQHRYALEISIVVHDLKHTCQILVSNCSICFPPHNQVNLKSYKLIALLFDHNRKHI